MFGSDARKKRAQPDADRRIAAYLIKRGDAARDARDWERAASWYEEALQLVPRRADIHVQRGHMLKESGRLEEAEQAYLAAQALTPADEDLALQFGHLFKLAGRVEDARRSYARAGILKPGWDAPARELAALLAAAEKPALGEPGPNASAPDPESVLAGAGASLANATATAKLVPAFAPRRAIDLLLHHGEGIDLRALGRIEPGAWGLVRTVRGVEAIRGLCISGKPIEEAQLLLDGSVFYRGPVRGPYRLKYEARPDGPQKYVFNFWYDFSSSAPGRHSFELRLIDPEGETRSFHDTIVIAEAKTEAEFPDSDGLVEISDPDPRTLERKIRTRPSMVRAARREVLKSVPRTILVLRTDQLGDMVASVPAMRRLRELFPEARLIGVLTGANADLAASLGLFDEIIVIDFPDDAWERRRLMAFEQQEALRQRFAGYAFDIAIDLAQSNVSRDLLQLSGAAFLYGSYEGSSRWLSASFEMETRDPRDRLENVPHSRKTLALVEALGAIVRDSFEVIRRPELTRDRLTALGIASEDCFAVLHMGARVPFSRWPGFPELAALLLERTDLKVVIMTEDPHVRETLPAALLASSRVILLDSRLPFDDFDAFVSFATVLVGNDSGPKHLASLRGTSVVTVHTARINWNDWGQEKIGSIVSRRVPCAGCNIFHDAEECGKDFACIRDIRPEEVFDAVKAYV